MFVVFVRFCHSSSLAFLISAYLINLMHHFLLHWVICFGGYLFVHTSFFFFLKNTWIFCVFLAVHHLVDNYAKIVDERGRNLMCDRTLPSRLVFPRVWKDYFLNSLNSLSFSWEIEFLSPMLFVIASHKNMPRISSKGLQKILTKT